MAVSLHSEATSACLLLSLSFPLAVCGYPKVWARVTATAKQNRVQLPARHLPHSAPEVTVILRHAERLNLWLLAFFSCAFEARCLFSAPRCARNFSPQNEPPSQMSREPSGGQEPQHTAVGHHARTSFNMCAWCRYTRGRFGRTHGRGEREGRVVASLVFFIGKTSLF